jgi:hypothetical protein
MSVAVFSLDGPIQRPAVEESHKESLSPVGLSSECEIVEIILCEIQRATRDFPDSPDGASITGVCGSVFLNRVPIPQ